MKFVEILTEDGVLATYSAGRGPLLVLLHGGPGDTHHYLRPLIRKLSANFMCVTYDQRGSGRSPVRIRDAETLHFEKFLSDLDLVIDAYSEKRSQPIRLLGHSWGAMLALYYAQRRAPLERLALVSLGPLTENFGQINSMKLLDAFSAEEKIQWQSWRAERSKALENNDLILVQHFDNLMMHLRVKSWVHNPRLYDVFLNDYFADPAVDRMVNKCVWESLPGDLDFQSLGTLTSPTLVCQGRQDSNPLEQLELLATHLPNATTEIIENCGHIPWLEEPELFEKLINKFLA
jgi:pimeloyl-ACP methyl ester carboxylesterase